VQLLEVISEQLKNHAEDIYVYVVDVNKYLMFKTAEEFGRFANQALPQMDYNFNRGDFIKYQIIATSQRQRLILTYDTENEQVAKNVCSYAKEHFKTGATLAYNHLWKLNQLVINVVLEKFSDNDKLCDEFHEYLETKERGLGAGLNTPNTKRHRQSGIKYITPIIAHEANSSLLNDYMASLPSNVDVIGNTKNDKPPTDWVGRNPPSERVNTKQYYDKYYVEMTKLGSYPISIQEVSKRVKELGFKNIKGTDSKHYWVLDETFTAAKPQPIPQPVPQCEPPEQQYEYTYLITTNPYNNLVKIGRTTDCEKRLRQLQTGSCYPLVIYARVFCPMDALIESRMHKTFSNRRRQGEWFEFKQDELHILESTLQLCAK